MKRFAFLLAVSLPLLLSACGSEDFEGRYIAPDGMTSYEFQPAGKLIIFDGENVSTAEYDYDKSAQTITLTAEQDLPADTIMVNNNDKLEMGEITLTRGVDYAMLADSTWIGNQGDYTFALTFNQTDKGLETYSELVTYYNDDMTYAYQTDDSITRLTGDKLFLDNTRYTVSDVSNNSLKLSIGNNSMVINKHPKGTAIEFRDGYTNIDDVPLE